MYVPFCRVVVEPEIGLENPWQRHTTPSLWELLIIFGMPFCFSFGLLSGISLNYNRLSVTVLRFELKYFWSLSDRHTEELVPVRVLETLPVKALRRDGGLPSRVTFYLQLFMLYQSHSVL